MQAWYQGGISVIDFTDSANPFEIAYFDRGPVHEEDLILAGFWSAYWYGGRIYGTEILRGVDVLALLPSDYLSENEIAAASLADQGRVFNPQQQFRVTWPAEPVVALAYLDQLARDEAVSAEFIADVTRALGDASVAIDRDGRDRKLARRLGSFAATARKTDNSSQIVGKRTTALADTIDDVAARLR